MMDSANKSEPLELGAIRAEVVNDLALAPFKSFRVAPRCSASLNITCLNCADVDVFMGVASLAFFLGNWGEHLGGCGCLHGGFDLVLLRTGVDVSCPTAFILISSSSYRTPTTFFTTQYGRMHERRCVRKDGWMEHYMASVVHGTILALHISFLKTNITCR